MKISNERASRVDRDLTICVKKQVRQLTRIFKNIEKKIPVYGFCRLLITTRRKSADALKITLRPKAICARSNRRPDDQIDKKKLKDIGKFQIIKCFFFFKYLYQISEMYYYNLYNFKSFSFLFPSTSFIYK